MVEVELWWRTTRGLGSDVGGTRVLGRCGSQAAGGRLGAGRAARRWRR